MRLITFVATLIIASLTYQMNAIMLSSILPTIAKELSASNQIIAESQTAFFISAAISSVVLLRFSDMQSRKKVLILALAFMLMGTLIAAIAPNMATFYVARVIQGVAGAVLPLCLVILHHEVADVRKFGLLMGLITAANIGIHAADSIICAVFAATYGFRSVFYFSSVMSLVAILSVAKWVPESKSVAGNKMDWLSTLLLTIALAATMVVITEASKLSNANWLLIVGLLLIACTIFVLFYILQGKVTHPFVKQAYLRKPQVWAVLLTTLLSMAGMFAIVNDMVVSYAQDQILGFALTPNATQFMILAPYAISALFVGCLAGKVAPLIGYNNVLRSGLVSSICMLIFMMSFGLYSLPALIIVMLFMGMTYAGCVNIILNGLGIVLSPKESPGFLPGMNAAAFHLGAAISFTLLPSIQRITTPKGSASLFFYFNGIALGTIIIIIALFISFLIPDPTDAEVKNLYE